MFFHFHYFVCQCIPIAWILNSYDLYFLRFYPSHCIVGVEFRQLYVVFYEFNRSISFSTLAESGANGGNLGKWWSPGQTVGI